MIKESSPILFSTEMVRAILSGTKTQTRRIIKPQPSGSGKGWLKHPLTKRSYLHESYVENFFPYSFQKLWVRETWAENVPACHDGYSYKADYLVPSIDGKTIKWRPSIHMPKIASRVTLKVKEVRIERLQDISEEDAIAEGIQPLNSDGLNKYTIHISPGHYSAPTAKKAFYHLWEAINGEGTWEVNPWVWVINFEVLNCVK